MKIWISSNRLLLSSRSGRIRLYLPFRIMWAWQWVRSSSSPPPSISANVTVTHPLSPPSSSSSPPAPTPSPTSSNSPNKPTCPTDTNQYPLVKARVKRQKPLLSCQLKRVTGRCYKIATCRSVGCQSCSSLYRGWMKACTRISDCGWPPCPPNPSPSLSCRTVSKWPSNHHPVWETISWEHTRTWIKSKSANAKNQINIRNYYSVFVYSTPSCRIGVNSDLLDGTSPMSSQMKT